MWEELRGQGTYSLYTSVVLGLKKSSVKFQKDSVGGVADTKYSIYISVV